MSGRFEWVEIIEPRSRERMYANLTTGECVWEPPEDVHIKRTDASQWWELFDVSTQRFYYYNVASQTTVWHRPNNCDIIPLAKLQTLKQNTDPLHKKDGTTQTPHSKVRVQINSKENKQQCNSSSHTKLNSVWTSDLQNSMELLSVHRSQNSHRLSSSNTLQTMKCELNKCTVVEKDVPRVQLTRSESFMSSKSPYSLISPSIHLPISRKTSTEVAGGISDDSMHENYFKSVENSPLSRRRRTTSMKAITKKECGSSNAQTAISPLSHKGTKSIGPSALTNPHVVELGKCGVTSNSKYEIDSLPVDSIKTSERYMDKLKHDKNSTNEPISNKSQLNSHQPISGKNSPSCGSKIAVRATSSLFRSDYDLGVPNISHPGQQILEKSPRKYKNKPETICSDVEYDNGNISPLYSNWDQEMQEHLLPLQYYIIEQAKLSGCYGRGDALDSDSFNSDSQSEHSFSGHEPDNEDSDHSDGPGDFLIHNYDMMNEYASQLTDCESYYNSHLRVKTQDQDEGSTDIENILENQKDTRINQHLEFNAYSLSPQPQIQQKPEILALYDQSSLFGSNETIERKQKKILENQKGKPAIPFQYTKRCKSEEQPQFPIGKDCDIEKFAQDNLNFHSKGIFRKKVSIRDMLSWTSTAITRPMLALARDKSGKKMAIEIFKLVQMYMGDRKARTGMTLNSVAIDMINMALGQQQLRDELYVQLCRQTTENPKKDSLIRGWELMAICLSFVPPSSTFQPSLLNYMNRHRDPTFAVCFPEVGKWPIHVQISHYATVCCRRLHRLENSFRKQIRKPNEDEIEQARGQILRDSMFGNTLAEVMELQKNKYPDHKLPWIQITLSEQVLLLNGKQTEGIFRVSADLDEVNILKNRLDRWEIPEYKNTMDAHAPASLLKLWYRELFQPLIPDELYEECVQTEDPIKAEAIIDKLPEINKLVLMYLVHFLQQFADPDVVSCTKMDSSNLAMVFAPNCLRCTSDDPKVILENARKEMAFVRTLIQHMDTSSIINLI